MTKKRIKLCYVNSKEVKNVYCADVWQTGGASGQCDGTQGYRVVCQCVVTVAGVFLDLD